MITARDVVSVEIPHVDRGLIRYNAQEAEIGGGSHVRSGKDRKDSLSVDQVVGQMVNYAGILYLTGSMLSYAEARKKANRNKYVGDGGVDVPGYRIDTKGSLMRASPDPLRYRLAVRPRERHIGSAYVLGLVPSISGSLVYLVGWWTDERLPPPDLAGTFRGAHTVKRHDLLKMPVLMEKMEEFKIGSAVKEAEPEKPDVQLALFDRRCSSIGRAADL